MTSTLFRLSMSCRIGGGERPPPLPFLRSGVTAPSRLLLGGGRLDVLGYHVGVGRVPVRDLLELAALYLPDLDEAATLVIGRRDLEGRHQPAQGEVGDLLEAGLRVDPGDLPVRLGLEGVANGLDMERADEHAAIVEDGGGHLLR